MLTQTSKLFSVVLLMLFISGCASNTTQKTVGFLGNYDNFVDSKDYNLTKIQTAANFDIERLASVEKIHLMPFELWLDNDAQANFNPKQLAELSQYFHQKLSTELLKKNYQLVNKPSAQALSIRGAFSGITFSDPALSPTDFIPFRIVLNAGNAAYLKLSEKKDVITSLSIEAEFLQGTPLQRAFALIATKKITDTVATDNSENLNSVKQVLNIWAVNFAKKLSKMRDTQ
jgi:hypothetical protein